MVARSTACLLALVGVAAASTSAANVYRPIRAVHIASIGQARLAPVRFVIAFDIGAQASLKQHLFVSYKIWDAHARVVNYAGAPTGAPRAYHGQITLRWNKRDLRHVRVATGRRYVVAPFVAAYPLDDPTGNKLQFVGGRPISFVLR